MSIKFKSMDDPYSSEVFEITKAGLFPYVDEVFGWDDDFQKQRMRDDYQAEWFYWAISEGTKIGYVCFKPYDQALHLHLIIIAKPFQGRGYGRKIMSAIHEVARTEERDITLSSFRCNSRAVELYKSFNYEVTEEEEHSILFRLPHNKNRHSDSINSRVL